MSEARPHHPAKSWILVILQFTLLIALVLLSAVHQASWVAWGLVLSSAVLGVWAVVVMGYDNFNVRPDVKSDARLVHEHLPYARIRHPMYSSVLLFSAGVLYAPFSWLKLALFIALIVVLAVKAYYEESLLRDSFPDYAAYQARTQRFIPYLF